MKKSVAFFLLIFSSFAFAGVTVKMHKEVSVDNEIYTLSDLAIVSGSGAALIGRIKIGVSPRPGLSVNLTAEKVKAKLYRSSPDLIVPIAWTGSRVVKVRAAGKELSTNKVITTASKALESWLVEKEYIDFSYEIAKKPDSILIPKNGDIEIFASKPSMSLKASKRMSIWVDVLVDNEQYHSYQIWYRIKAMQNVYIAAKKIPQNSHLEYAMFTEEVIDVARLNGMPADSQYIVDNRKILREMSAGDVLLVKTLGVIPLISRGDLVDVYLGLNGVDIKTKAVALKDGNLKEKIKVLNPSTKNSYMAMIVGEQTVRVE